MGAVTQATGSVNLGAIPIACLLAAGIVVFLFAAKVNRPFLERQAAQEHADSAQASAGGQPAQGEMTDETSDLPPDEQ